MRKVTKRIKAVRKFAKISVHYAKNFKLVLLRRTSNSEIFYAPLPEIS